MVRIQTGCSGEGSRLINSIKISRVARRGHTVAIKRVFLHFSTALSLQKLLNQINYKAIHPASKLLTFSVGIQSSVNTTFKIILKQRAPVLYSQHIVHTRSFIVLILRLQFVCSLFRWAIGRVFAGAGRQHHMMQDQQQPNNPRISRTVALRPKHTEGSCQHCKQNISNQQNISSQQ